MDIHERTMSYSMRTIRFYRHLQSQRDAVGLVIGRQFLRSAASVGSNLIEAQAGESRRDFVHKCSISQKEARESKYWLILLKNARIVTGARLAALINETDQLIAILTSIIVKAKKAST